VRRRAWLAAALAAPALEGCAALAPPPMVAALRQSSPGLPRRHWLADTPFVAGDDGLCGPAVLAESLAAAGRTLALDTLSAQVYLPGRGGTLQAEMLAGAWRQSKIGRAHV
jgi:hypothetical protein